MKKLNIWEIFLRESYRIFRAHGVDDKGHVTAYIDLHEDVVTNDLSPAEALGELADPQKVSTRLADAYRFVKEEAKIEKGQDYQVLNDQMGILRQSLDEANRKLDLAKKRSIKYFWIGLAVGVATRFAFSDAVKEQANSWLFSKKPTPELTIKNPLQYDPVTEKSMLDLWNEGGIVKVRLKNEAVSVYLEPNYPPVYKSLKPQHASSPH